jgi:hypothetical protein
MDQDDRRPPSYFTRQLGIGYQSLYHAILRGVIDAEQAPNGRWYMRASDLPRIAKALGVDGASPARKERKGRIAGHLGLGSK